MYICACLESTPQPQKKNHGNLWYPILNNKLKINYIFIFIILIHIILYVYEIVNFLWTLYWIICAYENTSNLKLNKNQK